MSFKLNRLNDAVTDIHVCGDRGTGGEFVTYRISCQQEGAQIDLGLIVFQDGPAKDVGLNGVRIEDLLDICAHRLQCFQTGPFACKENESSLQLIQLARTSLANRTADRKRRDVEGSMQP